MKLTDLNGPLSLELRSTGAGRILRAVQFAVPRILFLSLATFGATISRAQDQQDQSVAEAARQERARKQEAQKSTKHVYTEEDLKHPHILTPEDRAQIEAKRTECAQKNNCSPAAPQNSPASLDANSQTPQIPLGDVARQLRKQKELQALKPKQTEPFHLPFETPALASPILPERPAIRPPAQPVLHPKSSSPKTPPNVFRRDPFAAVPVRPEVQRPEIRRSEIRPRVRENVRPGIRPEASSDIHPKVQEALRPIIPPNVRLDFSNDVHPTLRAHGRLISPAQPKISSHFATPSILVQRVQPSAPAAVSTIRPSEPSEIVAPVQPVAPAVVVQPAQPTRAPSAVIATQHTISVRPGDSLWKLAQLNLGRGNRWRELFALNPKIANPNRIRAGAQLNLPDVAVSPVLSPIAKTNAATTIKVRKGDTLWALAKSILGRSSAWPCLATANPSLTDPNRIYENQELVIPVSCRP
jgi:nucleoid-associated protein YgaU